VTAIMIRGYLGSAKNQKSSIARKLSTAQLLPILIKKG
jgi:hypothetical protein